MHIAPAYKRFCSLKPTSHDFQANAVVGSLSCCLVGLLACWLVGHQALSALGAAVPLQHILPDQQVGKASNNDVFLIYY